MALVSLDRTKANDEMMETSYKVMRPCSCKLNERTRSPRT